MKRILFGLITIGIVATTVFGLTYAFFSDSEKSTDNKLQAGEIDLLIDNTSYLNGILNQGTTWEADNLPGHLFFNFTDIKPGDIGEDTISLRVENNDAWACAQIVLTKNDDNTCNEPETKDDPTCLEPNGDLFDGELAQNTNMVFWVDDGDNVLEVNEATSSGILLQGSAQTVLNNFNLRLADSTKNIFTGNSNDPLKGTKTYYIGKAWCFGNLTLTPLPQDGSNNTLSPANSTSGVSCDGKLLNNSAQTDILLADLSFSAVQSRHNPDFSCDGEPEPSATPSGSPSPSPQACGRADVMLVLDRSGSISSFELSQLKTAAKDFIDSLGLTALGIHAGKSSFSTTGSLNHHLTSNPVSLKAAIDAITSGGFTNLKAGIDIAKVELDNPGDGHDRVDLDSPDKMIIITDGNPNRPLPSSTADNVAATSADNARASGIEIFVVGVGSDVDSTYLQNEIADDASHYFSVANYNNLKSTLENLDLCQ